MSHTKPSNSKAPDSRVTLHMIGHAHIDPVWLWRWPEGYVETRATFRSALDRMKEFPDFIFTASAAAHYEWIERSDPAMFREIRKRVKQGRWVPAGGWWVEADVNIPCGESLVRQGLKGQRYFREKLGFQPRVGFSPDTFGHCAQLPKILAGQGLEAYLYMRPNDEENPAVPMPVYRWIASDGSSVICLRIIWSYNANTLQAMETKHKRVPEIVADSPFRDHIYFFYGVGNHGGGPTIELLKTIKAWQKDPKRHNLEFSSLERYLDIAKTRVDQLPEWREEMQGHALGCLSVQADVKATNRRAEETLLSAESWASLAQMVAKRKPDAAKFDRAWKDLLFNQFHDILPGSSVAEAYVDARDQVGGAIHAANSELTESLASISGRIDTRGEGIPMPVFNHQPFDFDGVIETEDIGFGIGNDESLILTDAKGQPIPTQRVQAHTACQRVRVVTRVKIPALGYTLLRQQRIKTAEISKSAGTVEAGARTLRNEHLTLSLADDGCLLLRGRHTEQEIFRATSLGGGGGVPLIIDDKSDTWSHQVPRFNKVSGRFEFVSAEVLEPGPVRGRLRVRFKYGESFLRLDYLLGAGERFVTVEGWIDWREHWKMLKLAFPTGLAAPHTTAEVPYGTATHPADGVERPMQQWVDISLPGALPGGGVAIVNNCKYVYSATDGEVRVTLFRSPPHAYDAPTPMDFNADQHFMDQGVHEFKLAIVPHAGNWRKANVLEIARLLNRPPTCLAETFRAGPLPVTKCFLTCIGRGVYVSAIKPAEDGGGWIVRAAEWFGEKTKATFALPAIGRKWSATFGAGQIKTFFVPTRRAAKVREVNLLEI